MNRTVVVEKRRVLIVPVFLSPVHYGCIRV